MIIALAAAGLLLAQNTQQGPVAPTPPAARPAAASEQPKPVCRLVSVTGSNFQKRVCHTAAEWEAIHDAARKDASAFQACHNGQGC